MLIPFQSLTRERLAALLLPLAESERPLQGKKRAEMRARQLFQWVYQRNVDQWSLMTDLSKDLRAWLEANLEIIRLPERQARQSMDGTRKFLWELSDQKTIESVVIPARGGENADEELAGKRTDQTVSGPGWSRLTACISSQVGCAMACKFCLTGIQGLDRHLGTHEIVAQVHELRRLAPISNVVFMGMGEPLHNLDHVSDACKILIDPYGLGLSKRKVTVSTSGIVPAIDELGARVDVSLAISLNATTDEIRSQIMPVNRKWPIRELLAACRRYPVGAHRKITFEYVLLKGVNDSLNDARRITELLRGIPSKVNLIPFNAHPGSEFQRPDDTVVRGFQDYLVKRGWTATVRISRGRDILAACGQLRSLFETARGTGKHKDWKPLPVMQPPSIGLPQGPEEPGPGPV